MACHRDFLLDKVMGEVECITGGLGAEISMVHSRTPFMFIGQDNWNYS